MKQFPARISGVLLGVLALALLGGCSTNPVTGKQELTLIGESQELAIGRTNYGPYRQAQGGDYVADPKLVEYVQSVGQRLVKVADRPLEYEFRIVNDETPNAWALPGGKIALNRGLLLELDSEAELAAVLSHEIVHAAARHSAQSMERGIFLQGAVLAAGVALGDSEYREAGLLGASLGAGLTKMYYSRDAESEADHYGINYMVRAGYDPQAAVKLQETFVRLSEGDNPGWLEGLFASHPPSPQRVEDNRRQVAALGNPGGELGRERYQKAIAHLKSTAPAYQAYRDAREAVEKGDLDKAQSLVDKAQRIEPKEALFDTLEGEIRERRDRPQQALTSYDAAVKKNPEYFAPYLARGLLHRRQGRDQAAQRDLEKSVALLPSAEAHYGLGLLARAAGKQQLALDHLRKAAGTEAGVGRDAGRLLAQLELPSEPGRYVKATLGQDRNGNLQVRIDNTSPLAVRDLRVVIAERTGGLLRERVALRIDRTLAAGRSLVADTGIGPVPAALAPRLQALVVEARIAD